MSLFSALRNGYYNRNGKSRKAHRGPGHSWSGAAHHARTRPSTLIETLESRQLLSALVTTDQQDYAPGSTALITASNDSNPGINFQVGETIQFYIDRTDGVPVNAPPAIQTWNVTDGVGGFDPYQDSNDLWWYPDTDGAADGNIGTTWYVDPQFAGASLKLTATGQTSGAVATTEFTDGTDISGFVRNDSNGDGNDNDGAVGLAGAAVTAYKGTNGNGTLDIGTDTVQGTATTGSNGVWSFSNFGANATIPCDGLVWFGNVDLGYHNRGHSSARIASRLARRVPTVYINSIGMRMPVLGRTDLAWSRYRRKLRSLLRGLRRDRESGLWIYSPWFVPSYSAPMVEFNGALLALQVHMLRRWLGFRNPSACISLPTFAPAVERLHWTTVVFERCDDFTAIPGADADLIAHLERRLLRCCDYAAYVSQELFERERERVAGAQLIGQGVDFEALAAARPIGGPRPPAPDALQDLVHPVVGFFGAMDDYRMDLPLMVKIARHIAPRTVLVIGPAQMDIRRLLAEPNVRYVGQLSPESIPAYAAQFDVGLIPFLNNQFNRRCNPVKLKEYLALGFPIVATDLPAYRPYGDLIATASSHEDFLGALDLAMAEDDPARARRRRESVSRDGWDTVADRFAHMLACPSAPPSSPGPDPESGPAGPPNYLTLWRS